MWKKVLAVLLIIAGLSVIGFPAAHDYYLKYQQKKMINHWHDNLLQVSDGTDQEHEQENPSNSDAVNQPDLTKEMEALLIIKKIDLEIPVLTGVTDRNLDLAAASILGTGKPGEIGNYCIAAHRSRTYGVLFNRLDELKKGDQIIVTTNEETYTYNVTESMIVQPDHVEVLQNDGTKRQITLITCDYSSKPYLRLIVKGELRLLHSTQ
ncbi:class D sortase [Dehalobacter sp. DCM]|uniref:class D sortase n=1 Tax=Dehalobacter sp. DCM TaxID=2907827 RepID=UPI0030819416|nr:class D sortase [Dehalobacter sp. DCM]